MKAVKIVSDVAEKTETVEPKEGLRYNKGKLDLNQLSPVAQACESLVYMFGAIKYRKNNWKGFKKDEQEAFDEFMGCALRHIDAIRRGEFFDKDSKQHHAAHAVWNLNRILDLYYYGNDAHGKDGKDLYHQPLKHELPETPTVENFERLYGVTPQILKDKAQGKV